MIKHEDDVSDGSDLGFIALCENYLHELRHGTIERHIHGYLKNREKLASGRWDDIVKCYGKYPLNGYENSRVFKVNYGFEEGGGYFEDLCDIDYDDMWIYANYFD